MKYRQWKSGYFWIPADGLWMRYLRYPDRRGSKFDQLVTLIDDIPETIRRSRLDLIGKVAKPKRRRICRTVSAPDRTTLSWPECAEARTSGPCKNGDNSTLCNQRRVLTSATKSSELRDHEWQVVGLTRKTPPLRQMHSNILDAILLAFLAFLWSLKSRQMANRPMIASDVPLITPITAFCVR